MIEEALLKSNFNGKDGFVWWIGQVAPKTSWISGGLMSNPEKRESNWGARCKVRIIGYHSFDGNTLADVDLPWAQIMIDPGFGSAQGGIGKTIELQGGETCFGFFLDGDDAQQPVIVGLLYRSDGVKNYWPNGEAAAKEKSSQFKPFTGHPGNIVPPTQRESRAPKDFTKDFTSVFSKTNNITNIAFDPKIGYIDPNTKNAIDYTKIPQIGDKLAGFNAPSAAFLAFEKKADVTLVKPNGCQNSLIGQITQGIQDFIAITNGLDRYMHVYIDPVLNEIVNVAGLIKTTANQILGIVRLIINNLRSTLFKCIGWLFRQIVGLFVPIPQQKKINEAFKKIMDKIFCILEKIPSSILGFIQGILNDLVQPLNAPACAVEQLTAGILAELMNGIDKALSVVISGVNWLANGIGTVSGLLNQASSLASQIFSFLECTGLACKTPHIWAAKFGPTEKQADDWQKMVSGVNIMNGIASGIGSISDAIGETSLYSGITGYSNSIFNSCTEKVTNPTSQSDIIPLPIGTKYPYCIPPIVTIVGDGIGASAIPIVNFDGSIFSIEVISGGMDYNQATVTIVDNSGCGNGATANPVIEDGSIAAIYVTDYGSGYASGNYTDINNGGTGGTGTGGTGGTGIGRTTNPGISSQISGCIESIVLVRPGYGYTVGDTITDGQNTYIPNVSPESGAIVSIQPLTNPICGFTSPPTLTINTNTGVGAEVLPLMKYYPTYVSVNKNLVNNQATRTGITTVVDCI